MPDGDITQWSIASCIDDSEGNGFSIGAASEAHEKQETM
jgi:hypothetical protein